MTMRGVILGTAAYMAPEQAKGKAVDKRADIWAFGCVLYEMLTGKRAFEGDDVTDIITSVMRDTPDWSALPAAIPPGVRATLRRCLEKDPRRRLRDVGDAESHPTSVDLRARRRGRSRSACGRRGGRNPGQRACDRMAGRATVRDASQLAGQLSTRHLSTRQFAQRPLRSIGPRGVLLRFVGRPAGEAVLHSTRQQRD